eukprot:snap_masked-scaffold1978_size23474-processed-gene-0.2 protein:Tk05432 transcript:snap_masked-scaffold1978_size23474-processed-gene-0.2-mRNA-1 annotation:"GM16961"
MLSLRGLASLGPRAILTSASALARGGARSSSAWLWTTARLGQESSEDPEDGEAQYSEPDDPRVHKVPLEVSLKYMESAAYQETYGDAKIWELYRRNFSKGRTYKPTRKMCVRQGRIASSNPCPICRDEYLVVDYRNIKLLNQFITDYSGELLTSEKTGVCRKEWLNIRVALQKALDRGYLNIDFPFVAYDYDKPTDFKDQRCDTNPWRKTDSSSLIRRNLLATAVPSVFPNLPSYLSREISSPRSDNSSSQRHQRGFDRWEEQACDLLQQDEVCSLNELASKLDLSSFPSMQLWSSASHMTIVLLHLVVETQQPIVQLALHIKEDLKFDVWAVTGAGFEVIVTITDGPTVNRQFYSELLCQIKLKRSVPSPQNPEEPLFLQFDGAHLFKNFYANFMRCLEFICPDFQGKPMSAQFDHIQSLCHKELGHPVKLAHKLTAKILLPRPGMRFSGCNYYVSVRQMLESEKKVNFKSLVQFSKDSLSEAKELLSFNASNQDEVKKGAEALLASFDGCDLKLSEPVEGDAGAMFYVAGYVARKLLRKTDCKSCHRLFAKSEEAPRIEFGEGIRKTLIPSPQNPSEHLTQSNYECVSLSKEV